MLDLMVPQTMFAVPVTLIAVMAVCVMALVVLRRIRMERPPVGVFNGRDIAVLYIFIIGLPLLYVVLPRWALTGFLIVTFAAALSIGYRTVLPVSCSGRRSACSSARRSGSPRTCSAPSRAGSCSWS